MPRNGDDGNSFSSSYSFSSYTTTGDDGEPRTRTQESFQDSNGRDETIERRQLGDRIWERRSDAGDMYDMLQDMDEEGLEQFEEDWFSEPDDLLSRLSAPQLDEESPFSHGYRFSDRHHLGDGDDEESSPLQMYRFPRKLGFGGAPSTSSRSFSSYSSTGLDGQTRSHSTRTFRGADGQVYSTERRQLGDRAWESETDGDGIVERYEGMDEDDLDQFEEDWMGGRPEGRYLHPLLEDGDYD